jgi:hypothetical protein
MSYQAMPRKQVNRLARAMNMCACGACKWSVMGIHKSWEVRIDTRHPRAEAECE